MPHTTPIADPDDLKSWARDKIGDDHDDVLDDMLGAATDAYERLTGLRVLSGTRSVFVDGDKSDGRNGQIVQIPASDRNVLLSGMVVKENDSTLVVAVGYTTTADVVLINEQSDTLRARLIRRPTAIASALAIVTPPGRWAPGIQNISLAYTSGWTVDKVPDDIVRSVCWLAYLLLTAPNRVGKVSGTKGRSSVTHIDSLPEALREMIESRSVMVA